MSDARSELEALRREGEVYRREDGGAVSCHCCAHRCRIQPGSCGVCAMRGNRAGKLEVPWGYVNGASVDPVEKKPFYHFLPGTRAFSFGMLGCNLRCPFCQNWQISQAARDPDADGWQLQRTGPEQIAQAAQRANCASVASTYNEPLITSEWGRAVFEAAKQRGLRTAYVSNGFATPEVLDYLTPVLDAMNVDLKCFTEDGYATLGGRLRPVLETIRSLPERGIWTEVVTLLVPGFNDSDEEIRQMAEFVASVGEDIPWHVSAYRAAYKYTERHDGTPPERLFAAAKAGQRAGLRYVYTGNIVADAEWTDTRCAECGETLVRRSGFGGRVVGVEDGHCGKCHTPVAGVWS